MGSSSHPNTRPMLWILYLSPNQPGRASLHDPFHPASTTDDYCNLLNFTHHLADSLDFEGLSLRVHWCALGTTCTTSSCLPHFFLLSSFHRFLKRRISLRLAKPWRPKEVPPNWQRHILTAQQSRSQAQGSLSQGNESTSRGRVFFILPVVSWQSPQFVCFYVSYLYMDDISNYLYFIYIYIHWYQTNGKSSNFGFGVFFRPLSQTSDRRMKRV